MTIFITTCKYSITLRFKNTVIVHIFYINYLIDIKIDLPDKGRKKNIFEIVICCSVFYFALSELVVVFKLQIINLLAILW